MNCERLARQWRVYAPTTVSKRVEGEGWNRLIALLDGGPQPAFVRLALKGAERWSAGKRSKRSVRAAERHDKLGSAPQPSHTVDFCGDILVRAEGWWFRVKGIAGRYMRVCAACLVIVVLK